MRKGNKIVALLLSAAMVVSLAACNKPAPSTSTSTSKNETSVSTSTEDNGGAGLDITTTVEADKLTFAEGTELRMATGYNSTKTGITFDPETAGEGVTLADGVTYHSGDLKPTWVELQNRLGMKFTSIYTGLSATKEFDYWKEQLENVDMVAGPAGTLSQYGEDGYLVNIAEYLDMMPNFKAYLESNSIVRLSITGSVAGNTAGAIYFSPYFDGVDDIERMPLMRTDWVVKLLDGAGEFTADACGNTKAPVYQPYMPTSGKVAVDVVELDGKTVKTINKDYDAAGNIVANMNAKGVMTGVEAVNMLRTYIDKAYNGYYGENRSNLFVGQNAAWDADELVALLRCVVANANTLNGTDKVQGYFSREDNNNQRQVDSFRFAGVLFGARGLESRQDFLYLDADGKVKDARQEVASYEAVERMNAMAQEGLISESFIKEEAVKSDAMLAEDAGFMSYDYNQTQTIYNNTKLDTAAGEKYSAVMVPVARWYDGTDANGVYMRFTESWRSVKTDAWAISKKGVADNQDKLYAALKLIDYAYSAKGMILMSYGPDAFIKTNADGSYVTFNFNGTEMPEIAEATEAELWEKAKGNYTNYARQFLGSTLSFVKSQAFEYQCTTKVGKEGAGYISNAIAAGTIKHPILAVTDNLWYTSVPTVLPSSTVQSDALKKLTDITTNFNSASGSDKINIFVDIIQSGYTGQTLTELNLTSRDALLKTITGKTEEGGWGGATYLAYKQAQWTTLLAYYNTTK